MAGALPFSGVRRDAFGKAEAAIDDGDFPLGGLRQLGHRRRGKRGLGGKDETPGLLDQPRRNERRRKAGNMRPERAAHGGKVAARQAFEQARMIPELELDDVGRRAPARAT